MAQPISSYKTHPAYEEFRTYVHEVPPGSWIGRLDHTTWGRARNLLLYFTVEATGEKCRLSTFWNNQFRPRLEGPAFNEEIPGGRYEITTKLTRNSLPELVSARKLD